MKWAWRLGRVAGIEVKVHATFLLLLGWVALQQWRLEKSLGMVASGIIFILALFACVLLHELGHALTARQFGLSTKHILLLPIGGMAQRHGEARRPSHEIAPTVTAPDK